MYSIYSALVLAILCLDFVRAGLFVVEPLQGSTCQANKPCTITWVDNGVTPLLSAVGVSTVGLYIGRQQLVQTLPPVDVSTSHSLTFTPNPSAGSNSDTYYIAITSITLKGNDSIPYSGWSSFFRLEGMDGSFDAPLSSATAAIPIPPSLTQSTSDGVATSTRIIGTLSTLPVTPATTATATVATTTTQSVSSSISQSFSKSRLPSSPSKSSESSTISETSTSTTAVETTSSHSPPTVASPTQSPTTFSTSFVTSLSSTSTALDSVGTSAAAVTSAPANSSSTRSASRLSLPILMLTIAASIIYSTIS